MKESNFYLSEEKCKELFELGISEDHCDIMASKIAINNVIGIPLYNPDFDTSNYYPSMSLAILESLLPREYDKGHLEITFRSKSYYVEYVNILTGSTIFFSVGNTMIDAIFNALCKIQSNLNMLNVE